MTKNQGEFNMNELILGSIADGVFTVDSNFKITTFNKAAEALTGWKAQEATGRICKEIFGNKLCENNCVIQRAMKERAPITEEVELKGKDGEFMILAVTATAMADEKGNLIGGVESFKDITENKRLAKLAEQQQKAILELSTPVVRVWDKVLSVPLIGVLDSERTQLVMDTLLQKIVDTQSRVVILDISGIPGIDTLVANHLIRTVTAARLLGAECIVTGVSSNIAQTLVHLGIDM